MFLAVSLWISGVVLAIQSGAPDAERRLQEAQEALESGRAAAAERLYRELIAARPYLLEAHKGLARALAEGGRDTEATEVLVEIGRLLLTSGRAREALPLLEWAVETAPDDATVRTALGRAFFELQAFEKSAFHWRRALEQGGDGTVRLYLAAALWESGRIDAAERVLRDAVSETERAPMALQELGALLLWRGRYREAADLLGEASRGDRESSDLWFDLGRALEGAGELPEAVEAYRRAVHLAPEVPQVRYRLGLLLARLGDSEAARRELDVFGLLQAFEQETLREEKRRRAKLEFAWDLIRRGEISEAVNLLQELGEAPDALEALAAARAAVGDHAAAVRALERAVTLAPDRRDLRLALTRQRIAAERAR